MFELDLEAVFYKRWLYAGLMCEVAELGQYVTEDAQRTAVSTTWIVDRDAVEGEHYDLRNLIKVWTMTNEQDAALVQRNQRGVNSVGYVPGPHSAVMEAGVNKFMNWYCERLARHLDGDQAAREAA